MYSASLSLLSVSEMGIVPHIEHRSNVVQGLWPVY